MPALAPARVPAFERGEVRLFGREKRRKNRKRDNVVDTAPDVAEGGIEAVADGCVGCDINLVIGFALIAGVPLLLWSI